MNIIITTVGTSLFTNYMEEEVRKCIDNSNPNKVKNFESYREAYNKSTMIPSGPDEEIDQNSEKTLYCDNIKQHFLWNMKRQIKPESDEYNPNKQTKKILWAYLKEKSLNKHACAEIQSIEAIIEEKKWQKEECHIYFLHTCTTLSTLAAKILCKDIYKQECGKRIAIKGLNVDINNTFNDEGFKNLADKIREIKAVFDKEQQNQKHEIILNITGGYKGTIPIVTLLGQLMNIPIFYIYEHSDTPIEIAKLPINFDWSIIESYAPYMTEEYLGKIAPNSEDYKKFDRMKLLKIQDDNVKMSGIGQILHDTLFKGVLANSILGNFVELKLYHHFCTNNGCFTEPVTPCYDKKIYYIKNESSYLFAEKPINRYKELGDTDLLLSYKKGTAVCEIKSYHQTITTLHNSIGSETEDYYNKIKPRIAYWTQQGRCIKAFLFIIYKIHILQESRNSSQGDNEKLVKVLEHFAEKIKNDYDGNVDFIAKEVPIDLRTDSTEINYTALFRKPLLLKSLWPRPDET